MPRPKSHILVIRLSAMGDVAIAVPLLNTIIHAYPELEITVLTKRHYTVLFEGIPRLHVKVANVKTTHKGLWGLYKLSRDLKAIQFSGVADIHNVLRSSILGSFLKSKTIRVVRIDKGRAEKKALTRQTHKIFKPLKTTAARYVEVFEKLGFAIDLENLFYLNKACLEEDLKLKLGYQQDQKKIGIAPFAAHEGKTYPQQLMQQVILELSQRRDIQLYLFGGGQNETQVLESWARPYPNVHNLAGKFEFRTELQLISNLDLMLSMDSGNGHLAAMYGVKVLSIWGQTHPYLGFAPYGQTEDLQLLPDRDKYPYLPVSVYGNAKGIDNYEILSSISPESIVEKISAQFV